MPPRTPRALLFDLDGTLADSIALLLASFHHTFGAHGKPVPSDAEWIAGIGTPLISQMRGFVPSEDEAQQMILTYREFQRQHHDEMLREFEGVADTLALLESRGHPMALVTSKTNDLAHRALDWLHLTDHIDVVVGMDSTERHKPDPEPVLHALAALGSTPDNALFLGDSPHDIAAGNAAGVISVAALWGPFSRRVLEQASPTYLLEHIRELPALLGRLDATRKP
ncbi:MAG TPA: HAD-IA family hydrolase [Gemmatimonadaceae bacterium]|nr:HAD-IA family hydrolase [Gemmatimonadaceae bacterium]